MKCAFETSLLMLGFLIERKDNWVTSYKWSCAQDMHVRVTYYHDADRYAVKYRHDLISFESSSAALKRVIQDMKRCMIASKAP